MSCSLLRSEDINSSSTGLAISCPYPNPTRTVRGCTVHQGWADWWLVMVDRLRATDMLDGLFTQHDHDAQNAMLSMEIPILCLWSLQRPEQVFLHWKNVVAEATRNYHDGNNTITINR